MQHAAAALRLLALLPLLPLLALQQPQDGRGNGVLAVRFHRRRQLEHIVRA